MTADQIAHCLATNLFSSDLVVVDRCCWPGAECDLLVVTPKLQVIDVEVKISRADLKVDRLKEKWFESQTWEQIRARNAAKAMGLPDPGRTPREWPQNIWKHYYAMPAKLWKPELAEFIHPTSGIITVDSERPATGFGTSHKSIPENAAVWRHEVVKRAKPNSKYTPIGEKAMRKIAYLASFRMWRAYADLHRANENHRRELAMVTAQGAA